MRDLRLASLPRGANRNRTSRPDNERQDEELSLAEVERLFIGFWKEWQCRADRVSLEAGPKTD